ncbi:hypothetical protein GF337_05810, partial [candidate division KSB1 bacterium]|nr:hypothetical protein [candidate division KSB1 bacterium]
MCRRRFAKRCGEKQWQRILESILKRISLLNEVFLKISQIKLVKMNLKQIVKSIGPGWIIAAVCLGPGSITTSSKIGSEFGYEFLWIIVAASIGMGIFMTMSTRYGVSNSDSLLQSIAKEYGRWFAVIIGISA